MTTNNIMPSGRKHYSWVNIDRSVNRKSNHTAVSKCCREQLECGKAADELPEESIWFL